MKVEKGKLVILSYKTYVNGKLVDSSEMHQDIEIVYGFTAISPELDENIKDKEIGHEFKIKQNINSKPIKLELPLDDFDEDTIEIIQNNKEIDLEINNFWYPFKVLKVDPIKNTVLLEYEDPFAGQQVEHKIKIKDIKNFLSEKK